MTAVNSVLGYPGYQFITDSTNESTNLGNGGVTTWPPNSSIDPGGWISLLNASVDDNYYQVPLPFYMRFYTGDSNEHYNSIYISTNHYLTFGTSPPISAFGNHAFNAGWPLANKLMFQSGDRSLSRIAYKRANDNSVVRIRLEGSTTAGGTLGAPTVVYEINILNPANTGQIQTIEFLVGNYPTDGFNGIYRMVEGSGISLCDNFPPITSRSSFVLKNFNGEWISSFGRISNKHQTWYY